VRSFLRFGLLRFPAPAFSHTRTAAATPLFFRMEPCRFLCDAFPKFPIFRRFLLLSFSLFKCGVYGFSLGHSLRPSMSFAIDRLVNFFVEFAACSRSVLFLPDFIFLADPPFFSPLSPSRGRILHDASRTSFWSGGVKFVLFFIGELSSFFCLPSGGISDVSALYFSTESSFLRRFLVATLPVFGSPLLLLERKECGQGLRLIFCRPFPLS